MKIDAFGNDQEKDVFFFNKLSQTVKSSCLGLTKAMCSRQTVKDMLGKTHATLE